MTQNSTPAAHDLVSFNGEICRIVYVGTGEYSIGVNDGFELDAAELSLLNPAGGYGVPAVWLVKVDATGHRF